MIFYSKKSPGTTFAYMVVNQRATGFWLEPNQAMKTGSIMPNTDEQSLPSLNELVRGSVHP